MDGVRGHAGVRQAVKEEEGGRGVREEVAWGWGGSKNEVSDWWFNAGIILKPSLPLFSTTGEGTKPKQGKVSVSHMHYLLSHVLLDDIRPKVLNIGFSLLNKCHL